MSYRLVVRVTPRAARDAVEGWGRDAEGRLHLKLRVRAVPEAGKANAAVENLLAATLGLAKRDVRVVQGATGRLKQVEIFSDPDDIEAQLMERFGDGS